MISAEKLKPLTKGIMSHPYIAGGVATGAIGGYAIRKDPEDAIIGAGLGAGAGYLLHNRVPTKLLPQEIKKAAINTKAIKQISELGHCEEAGALSGRGGNLFFGVILNPECIRGVKDLFILDMRFFGRVHSLRMTPGR